jgi:hypothetical protein
MSWEISGLEGAALAFNMDMGSHVDRDLALCGLWKDFYVEFGELAC